MRADDKVAAPTAKQLLLVTAALFSSLVTAQQVGNIVAEIHPRLTTWRCTTEEGCRPQNTSVVLDANFRWIHAIGGADSCTTHDGGLNRTLCPDAATCARNCALEGANYTSAGVITSSGSSLTLDMYVDGRWSSPRVYLLGEDGSYEGLQLLGQELTFDVDMSKLPCGMNGALYLSEMSLGGGKGDLNSAGASMGTGYCDAQCPVTSFINGEANTNSSGACCNEMDVWEANNAATALTPHTCSIRGVYACAGQACLDGARGGVCDKSGCVYNAYGQGYHGFYGPNGTIDTAAPFTVVTQFLTTTSSSNSTGGQPVLQEIRRIYIQNGKVTTDASSPTASQVVMIDDAFCGDGVFAQLGGLEGIGRALQRGMVLVFSIWNDNDQFMNWLDSDEAGPCDNKAGDPTIILEKDPGTSVTWSDVRWGDIGSTFGNRSNPAKL